MRQKSINLTLRTKIFLITTLLILLIQGMNSVLEIGFLYRNLEQNSLKKYQVIGKEIARKLQTSLMFGKPLDQLDFGRLLDGMVPDGLDNFAVLGVEGRPLYALAPAALTYLPADGGAVFTQKSQEQYLIAVALTKQEQVMGHVAFWVPLSGMRDKLSALIQSSIVNSLIIIGILLPLLYFVLTLRVEAPFKRRIQRMHRSLAERDARQLMDGGIDPQGLIEAENCIERMHRGEWLNLDKTQVYEKLEIFLVLGKAVLNNGNTAPALKDLLPAEELALAIQETQTLIDEHTLCRQLSRDWQDLQSQTLICGDADRVAPARLPLTPELT